MPSAIAIRIYCVNLFDIFYPRRFRCSRVWQIPGATQHAWKYRQFATMFPLWNGRAPTSVRRSAQSVQLSVFCAASCIKNRQMREGNAMAEGVNRQVLLVEKPTGKLAPEHFKMSEGAIPEPKDGEALLRVRYISLDAANRAWMHGATYRAAVEANTVMAGGGIAEVVASNAPGLAPGDIVFGDTGWQDYAVVPAKHLAKMPKVEPMTHLLSVYGIAGLTAYFGLLDVGKPKAGETVGGCAAAGAAGWLCGRIAKIKGCRVVGIAGGKDKCNWLTSELGFDAAVDYKDGAVFKALRAAAAM